MKPTTAPVETKAPSGNAQPAAKSGEAAKKVGEADYTIVLVSVVLAGATGMIVLGKKRGKQN